MIRLLQKQSTYWFLRSVGYILLVWFLFTSEDHSFSIIGAVAYFLSALAVSYAMVALRLGRHFPKLNHYHFSRVPVRSDRISSENDQAIDRAKYLEEGFQKNAILFTPSEDGLICIPILLVGINPVTASLGGLTFGLLHLGRFNYLECIGKSIYYGIACYLILPYGLITVIVGHLITDLFGLAILRFSMRASGNDAQC